MNLKHYSQTCSNDHLCKTTNAESAQANSRSVATSATSNDIFDSQMKKNLSKTISTKLYPAKECGKNIRDNALKINVSPITFAELLIYSTKFV